MEHVYSIMPLAEDHFEERICDLVDRYKRRITSCPLFDMTLVPEGESLYLNLECAPKGGKLSIESLLDR